MIEIALGIVTFLFLISAYYNYRFAITIINTQEAIESSLDILDSRYQDIHKLINTPILYDSPQIKKLIADMKLCRDSILEVANVMTSEEVKDGEER